MLFRLQDNLMFRLGHAHSHNKSFVFFKNKFEPADYVVIIVINNEALRAQLTAKVRPKASLKLASKEA